MLELSVGLENFAYLPLTLCNLEFAIKIPNNVLMTILIVSIGEAGKCCCS